MRIFAVAVVAVIFGVSTAFAQNRHAIAPDRYDNWSICINVNCLDLEGEDHARIGVEITGYYSSYIIAELTCRFSDDNQDYIMAQGSGREHLLLVTQITRSFWRWCNVNVYNYRDFYQEYSIQVAAVPEGPPTTTLWPGRKQTRPIP